MLPSIEQVRKSKRFHLIRVGSLKLWFSLRRLLIAFGYEGHPPLVCKDNGFTDTTKGHAREVEPDESKWLTRQQFEAKWLEVSHLPITNPHSVAAIEAALADTNDPKLWSIREHLRTAQRHLSDPAKPDYRNSIKESISAVEAMCRLIAGTNATLGQAIKKLEIGLAPELQNGFSAIYGFTNDKHGIRHSLTNLQDPPPQEDAVFMLAMCSSFVSYLKVKAAKAGKDGFK